MAGDLEIENRAGDERDLTRSSELHAGGADFECNSGLVLQMSPQSSGAVISRQEDLLAVQVELPQFGLPAEEERNGPRDFGTGLRVRLQRRNVSIIPGRRDSSFARFLAEYRGPFAQSAAT